MRNPVKWDVLLSNPNDRNVVFDFAEGQLSTRAAIHEVKRPEARKELYKLERQGEVMYARKLARSALRRRGLKPVAPTNLV